jgi:hypothetical protein
LLTAAIVGVLSNAGAGHPPTDFSVFGYHLTGSTGTLFLFGIAVGAVASFGLCLLSAGARHTVLILVTATAALFVLTGALVLVVYKTRTRRNIKGTTICDQAEEDALRLRRQEALAELDATAHAARADARPARNARGALDDGCDGRLNERVGLPPV